MGSFQIYFPKTIISCSLSIALYHDEPKFFIHHPTMMLYPTNSAGRRQQQPCTTTIRSRRAHPRRVLDTAALNAYVPNDVGSKSHSEFTWNHVVYVFTFFGLLMTALVSLCCWSHFQFIVERRRLAAERFDSTTSIMHSIHGNSLPCYRRRLARTEVTIQDTSVFKAAGEPDVNGEYTKRVGTDGLPKWLSTGKDEYFDGSKDIIKGGFEKEIIKNGKPMPWYMNDKGMVIFWCGSQKKWHLCGENKLYYRSAHVKGTADDVVPISCGIYDTELKKMVQQGWMTDFENSGTKGGKKTFSKGKRPAPFTKK